MTQSAAAQRVASETIFNTVMSTLEANWLGLGGSDKCVNQLKSSCMEKGVECTEDFFWYPTGEQERYEKFISLTDELEKGSSHDKLHEKGLTL